MNKKIILFLISATALSSCGVNQAFLLKQNLNPTPDQLSSNNFKILKKVVGSADVAYGLGFGRMSKTRLYESAYADLRSNAIINGVTIEHIGGVIPFSWKGTLTVSTNVFESSTEKFCTHPNEKK